LLGLSWAVAAPQLKDKPRIDDRLLGSWLVVRAEVFEDHTRANAGNVFTFRADGTFIFRQAGEEVRSGRAGKYVVGPAANPPTIDLTLSDNPTFKGVYRVDGDTLTLRLKFAAAGRPTSLEPIDGEGKVFSPSPVSSGGPVR